MKVIYLVVLSCPWGVSFTRYPELDGTEHITSAVIVKLKSEAACGTPFFMIPNVVLSS